MTSTRRLEKLNAVLREELSKILLHEIEFPENDLVTITRLSISPDARYAAVFLSILAKDPQMSLEILEKKIYNIQRLLNRRLRIRPVPKIRFAVDEEELKRERIEKTLAKLKQKGEI